MNIFKAQNPLNKGIWVFLPTNMISYISNSVARGYGHFSEALSNSELWQPNQQLLVDSMTFLWSRMHETTPKIL